MPRAHGRRGGVPHPERDRGAGDRPVPDLDRRARHGAAARLPRIAPARRGDREPVPAAAGARGGDRPRPRRWRPRVVQALGDVAARGGVREADLLVSARCRAADAANVDGAHHVRLVGAVAARVGDVVGGVSEASSRARLRPRPTPLGARIAARCWRMRGERARNCTTHPRWCPARNGSKASCAHRRRAWSAGASWRRRASNGRRG